MANQPSMQPQEQSNAAPPQTQITAAPRFVRQAPAAAPQYFGGVAGGPMSGFGAGMGGGVSPSYGAGGPMMTPTGFAAPTAAMSTAQLAQAYNPFGQQMVSPAAATGTSAGLPQPGMIGGYLPEMAYGGPEQLVTVGSEDTDAAVGGDAGQINVVEPDGTPDVTTASPEEGYAAGEPEGPDYTLEPTAPEGVSNVDPYGAEGYTELIGGEEGQYLGPDGETYTLTEDGYYIPQTLEAGELLDENAVDDYTYGQVMASQGVQLENKFEYSQHATADYDMIENQYATQMKQQDHEIGAAARAFQEWAARSGIAFSPTAMANYQGQLSSQFASARGDLELWREEQMEIEGQDAEDAMTKEWDTYQESVNTTVENWIELAMDDEGSKYGLSASFQQWARQHVGRMKDIGLSLDEIEAMLPRLPMLWQQETGHDAYEETTGPTRQNIEWYYDGANQSGNKLNTTTGVGTGPVASIEEEAEAETDAASMFEHWQKA